MRRTRPRVFVYAALQACARARMSDLLCPLHGAHEWQTLPIDGVPLPEGRVIIVSSFILTALFGFIVVILLLSMIIARFSRTVASIDDSIDSIYKLKFAQMTVLYTARLQSSQVNLRHGHDAHVVAPAMRPLCAACLAQYPPRAVGAPTVQPPSAPPHYWLQRSRYNSYTPGPVLFHQAKFFCG